MSKLYYVRTTHCAQPIALKSYKAKVHLSEEPKKAMKIIILLANQVKIIYTKMD